jgi:hypothetical protein
MKKFLLIPFLFFILLNKILFATVINVPGQFANIQAAINSSTNGDTVLVADGIYSGAGNYNIDFGGKRILVTSQNGAANTIIDCMNSGRGIYFQSNEDTTAVVDGFTIKNGTAPTDYGGAISCFWSSPLIKNCVLEYNNAERGGAIALRNCSAIIRDCVLRHNSATWSGGIHFEYADATVMNTIINNNSASTFGGLGILWSTTLNLFFCSIDSNICNQPIVDIDYGSSVRMYRCTVRNNTDMGIHVDGSTLLLINSLVSNNSNYGLWAVNSNDTIINSTIVFNHDRGIHSQNSQFNIINSIIFFNTGKQIYLLSPPIPNISYCNIQNRLSGGIVGAINWGAGNIDANPLFEDTLLKNYHLTANSSCINAGTLSNAPVDDLDANTRPIPAGTFPDIGAYEFDQGTSGISEIFSNEDFVIYPNPTSDKIYFVSKENFEWIKIKDVLGNELMNTNLKIEKSVYELDLSNFSKGIYFVEIKNANKFLCFKEIKN